MESINLMSLTNRERGGGGGMGGGQVRGHEGDTGGMSLIFGGRQSLEAVVNRFGLMELQLSNLSLTHIPPEVFHLTRLEMLLLSNNQITDIPEEIVRLPRLRLLDASNNNIQTLPHSLAYCSSLTELYLHRNCLSTLLPGPLLGALTQLRSLRLSHNSFLALPPDFGLLSSLRRLDLSGNSLWQLPPSVKDLVHLHELNLSHNQFVDLPQVVCLLRRLQVLDAGGNRLNGLPPEFETLRALRELRLAANRFTAVPRCVCALGTLIVLDMSDNAMSSVTSNISQLHRLKVLCLQNNSLDVIPTELPSIECLNVSSNHLQALSVAHMRKLKRLEAANNRLEAMPHGIYNLSDLEELDLAGNRIGYISQDIVLLKRLRVLDLSSNVLTILPRAIDDMNNLLSVNITGNNILVSRDARGLLKASPIFTHSTPFSAALRRGKHPTTHLSTPLAYPPPLTATTSFSHPPITSTPTTPARIPNGHVKPALNNPDHVTSRTDHVMTSNNKSRWPLIRKKSSKSARTPKGSSQRVSPSATLGLFQETPPLRSRSMENIPLHGGSEEVAKLGPAPGVGMGARPGGGVPLSKGHYLEDNMSTMTSASGSIRIEWPRSRPSTKMSNRPLSPHPRQNGQQTYQQPQSQPHHPQLNHNHHQQQHQQQQHQQQHEQPAQDVRGVEEWLKEGRRGVELTHDNHHHLLQSVDEISYPITTVDALSGDEPSRAAIGQDHIQKNSTQSRPPGGGRGGGGPSEGWRGGGRGGGQKRRDYDENFSLSQNFKRNYQLQRLLRSVHNGGVASNEGGGTNNIGGVAYNNHVNSNLVGEWDGMNEGGLSGNENEGGGIWRGEDDRCSDTVTVNEAVGDELSLGDEDFEYLPADIRDVKLLRVAGEIECLLKEQLLQPITTKTNQLFGKSSVYYNKTGTLRSLRGLFGGSGSLIDLTSLNQDPYLSPYHPSHPYPYPSTARQGVDPYTLNGRGGGVGGEGVRGGEVGEEGGRRGREVARSRWEIFRVTPAGGLFRSTADLGVGMLFPRQAIEESLSITLQIERMSGDFLDSARRLECNSSISNFLATERRSLISNLLAVGDIVHVTQSRDVTFNRYVTMTVPAPLSLLKGGVKGGGRVRGRLHVLMYGEDGSLSCAPCPYGTRREGDYIVIRAWHLASFGAVLTRSSNKLKACASMERLRQLLLVTTSTNQLRL